MVDSRTRLPEPAPRLRDDLLAFLSAQGLGASTCYLGFSGGCDSLSLLHVLREVLAPGSLSAVHVHHGLSLQADAWADFCRQTCAQWDIPLQIVRVQVRACGEGLEAAARTARYAALAAHLPPGAPLFLAQHRDDQAETVLFNLLRGSGVQGLAAMRARRGRQGLLLLRPWLGVSRQIIEAYAREQGLRWIEDESNVDQRFSRNFLRHRALPVLRERFPGADIALAQAAQHCAEAADLLGDLAALDWQQAVVADVAADVAVDVATLCLSKLRGLSAARLKNLLRWWLRALTWQVPAARRLEEFCRQIQQAGPDKHPRLSLAEGCLYVQGGALRSLTCATQRGAKRQTMRDL